MHHPVPREHSRPSNNGCWGYSVDAHIRSQAQSEFAHQVIERGFTRVVGLGAALRNECIGGTGQHHGSTDSLFPKYPFCLLGQQEVAGHINLEGFGPLRFCKPTVRAGNRINRRRVHYRVDPAELQNGQLNRCGEAVLRRKIRASRNNRVRG